MRLVFFLVLVVTSCYCLTRPCNHRYVGLKRYICVCNVSYCDTVPKVNKWSEGQYNLFVTNRKGLRVQKFEGHFEKDGFSHFLSKITINRGESFQVMEGFGASFTDSAGSNIASLPKSLQHTLLDSMFSEDGSEYSLARVPIGGSDFSSRPYTYQDRYSDGLGGFSLQKEDFDYKIPLILQAVKKSKVPLKLVASPWSAPAWAKTNNDIAHGGFLKTKYYQYWADYLIKFFDEYEKRGIKFWAVTTQNEPASGLLNAKINCMAWFPYQLRKFIVDNLGPSLRNSSHSNLKLLIHDDQRTTIAAVQEYFFDPEALKYIDGVAVHWYMDNLAPPALLEIAKTDKKDVFLISTEASFVPHTFAKPVSLGNWKKAEITATYMMQDFQYNSTGWIDWNMALDLEGGPCWVKNPVDAAIIVNSKKKEFYKQPMYYSILHFSKFVPRGSKRIGTKTTWLFKILFRNIHFIAFRRPDKGVSLIILNTGFRRTIKVYDEERGSIILHLSEHSINTLVYY